MTSKPLPLALGGGHNDLPRITTSIGGGGHDDLQAITTIIGRGGQDDLQAITTSTGEEVIMTSHSLLQALVGRVIQV